MIQDILNIVGAQAVKRGVSQLPLSERNSLAVKLGVSTDTSAQHLNSLILVHLSSRCNNASADDTPPSNAEDKTQNGAQEDAQDEVALLKEQLAAVLAENQELERKFQKSQLDFATCKAERDQLHAEVTNLQQKQRPVSSDTFPLPAAVDGKEENLADKVSELQQENIVLGAMYRNACRRIERLENQSDNQLAQPSGAAVDSGDASPKQQNLNETALPLEECRKLCPPTSVKQRTQEWVLNHSWLAAQTEAVALEESEEETDHGFLSGSMSLHGSDEDVEEEEGHPDDDDATLRAKADALPVSTPVQLAGYRGNPVNRVARAAWKKSEFGAFPGAGAGATSSPAGPSGYDVLGSFLGGLSKAAKRKEVDIVTFDP